MPAVAPSGHQRPPGSDKSDKLKSLPPPVAQSDDEETTTDDDSSDEEEAALEMDGQELWTQNYCATCDCLIEPGEGLAKAGEAETSRASHTSLKSRSGTIKARVPDSSSDHPPAPAGAYREGGASTTSSGNGGKGGADLKRTNSAGRLQARGPNGPLGPHKRTGSAGSRLNALSELRPTTKLHPTQDDVKGKGKADGTAKGPGRRSPAISRRSSTASVKSLNHSNSGLSSVKSDEATAAKPKSRGFLGGLTPVALKQQQAEMAEKKKTPAQLYCSERCRAIDQDRSSGLGELSQYLSQPLQPVGPAASQWPRSTSLSSVSIPYVAGTPESECMCPECMEKYVEGGSAGGATVPSGASDTTESSGGHIYGRPGAGQKARTASGRIVTPLNLHPPGGSGAVDSYFPVVAGHTSASTQVKRNSASSLRSRQGDGVAFDADKRRSSQLPPRTSTGPVGSASTADTESTGSNVSLWEPKLRRPYEGSAGASAVPGTIKRTSPAARRARSNNSDDAREPAPESLQSGRTTVTATPAVTPRHSTGPALEGCAQTVSVPATNGGQGGRHSRRLSTAAVNAAAASFTTSPLHLLRGSSLHQHAAPSVDVWHEHAGSFAAAPVHGSFVSRSLAGSEHTLPGSSGITVPGPDSTRQQQQQQQHHHHHRRSTSYAVTTTAGRRATTANIDMVQGTGWSSPRDAASRREDNDDGGQPASVDNLSLAVGNLKMAQSRAHERHTSNSLSESKSRRLSLFGPVITSPTGTGTGTGGARRPSISGSCSNSGWFRSISSAWATLRGAPPDLDLVDDEEGRVAAAHAGHGEADETTGCGRRSSQSRSPAGRLQFREPAPPMRRDLSSQDSSQQRHQLDAMLSQSGQAHGRDDTPTQSLVAKPTIRRGRVPAFVNEIGHGEIPGDASEHYGGQAGSYAGVSATAAGISPEFRSREGSFSRTAAMTDEEKARRRQERKEANRQRRSRDVHVLPPLLAPISRTNSSINLLYGNVPHSARAASHSRTRTQSSTPQMVVGSAGSNGVYAGMPPQRSATPGMAGHPNGLPSPAMMRSPFQGAFPPIVTADGRTIVAPSRPGSAAGFYSSGTSPRAKGLGWSAMTSIVPGPMAPPLTGAGAHHHSTSIGYGHVAAAAASRAAAVAHHGHRHSHHGAHYHAHGPSPHGGGHHHQRGPHPVRHHTSLQLGTLGMLGAHPHGHAPVVGRHSTMPTLIQRSPTPSVPEDGGEMTSRDLTSGDFISRPSSAMSQAHRSRAGMMPPPRSRSSMGGDASSTHRLSGVNPSGGESSGLTTMAAAAPPLDRGTSNHNWSYEALPGLKTYPVLQLPNRETHDVYDSGWGLDAGGLAKHLTGRAQREEGSGQSEGRADGTGPPPSQHRKKLFYFDA